ncbi:6-phosphofructokinase [Pelagibaculum spongiae]|uniref:ATP-dependent 6-phosphofructokinase n=1 Tax=Pelagibaculum spongiae TaxID=2080658 RepID=A0A2V1GZD4_9GAMM|nr:6-phosphofructokinase [Pelagibaculum spongiae]PVZ71799.1 6-phosphofructokinase [Pelagibaculum spongiae]
MLNGLKKIGVMTSGGDAPGMNAAVRAVVRACSYYEITPCAIYSGYQGLIDGKIEEMGPRSVANILSQGGTVLKSARCMEFRTEEGRRKAYEQFMAAGLGALIVIGGDGSFTGARLFQKEFGIPVVGIPGTIDNDIFGTDFTIGYDTALNTVVDAVDKIRDTASSHDRLFFIEVMGRDAGFIALNSGIATGVEQILIPEINKPVEQLIDRIRQSGRAGKGSSMIMVAEGDKSGSNIYQLADKVQEQLPEYDIKVTVLGHIQRGGRPSCSDRVLASRLGVAAVKSLKDGISGVMVGVRKGEVALTPLEEAIKQHNEIDPLLLEVAEITSI